MTDRVRHLQLTSGVTAVEVLIGTVLLAVVLLGLVGLGQSQERTAQFLEMEEMAQRRARALVDHLAAADLEKLFTESAGRSGLKAAPDGVNEAEVTIPAGVESFGVVEPRPVSGLISGAPRLSLFKHEAWIGSEEDGAYGVPLLFRIRVRVTWTFPGDKGPIEHRHDQVRLVAHPGTFHRTLPEVR